MKRIIKNLTIIIFKAPYFKRCCIYSFASSLFLVMLTWIIHEYMPEILVTALGSLGERGELNLGYIQFESIEQIKQMTAGEMYRLTLASPFIPIIVGVFAVTSYWNNIKNGYFDFLITRKISRIKIYCSHIISSALIGFFLLIIYGITSYAFSSACFGYEESIWVVIALVRQLLSVLAIVSIFTFFICVSHKLIRTVCIVIVSCIGGPAFLRIVANMLEEPYVEYLWIGKGISYVESDGATWFVIYMVSIITILVTVIASSILFARQDM